jgi:hypothetical protein
MRVLGVLLADPRTAGLSVAEVNPDHDPDGTHIVRLTRALAGAVASVPTVVGRPTREASDA